MNYKTMNASLELAGIESITTSELHGFIAGGVCTRGSHFYFDEALFEGLVDDNPPLKEGVNTLIHATLKQLNQPHIVPSLLLPDDDAGMALRCRCLTEWCQGFLFALGVSGLSDKQLSVGDVGEIIKDFIEISHSYKSYYEENDEEEETAEVSEENEKIYAEVVEYLRAGLMLINESLSPAMPNDSSTLH